MTLTQQFLIVSFLPLSLLGIAAYVWRQRPERQRLALRWTLTLLAAAVWASSVLRFYGGVTIPVVLTYNWGIIGRYAFVVTAVLTLATTIRYLTVPDRQSKLALGMSVVLALLAIGLDPLIITNRPDTFAFAGQQVRPFDLWAAVWIVSWLLPLLSAWLLTQQINAGLSRSLFRNQVHYWLVVLTLFFVGGILTSIQDPGRPVWQELGVLVVLVGAAIGTITLTSSQLPDLQLAARRLLSRLSGTLIIFGLTWAALSGIVAIVANLPEGNSATLILILAAALFAGLFTLIYRFVNDLTQRLFLPALSRREAMVSEFANAAGTLPTPSHLAELFLQVVRATFAVDDAGLLTVQEAAGGRVVLRPLASIGDQPISSIDFAGESPFTTYLRQNTLPLVHQDLETLRAFSDIPSAEMEQLATWQRVLYMPLHAGDVLVAVLMLGAKSNGDPYDRRDFEQLQRMGNQLSPLLAQAQNMAQLRQINDHVFAQNQALARDRQHLRELSDLYGQMLRLITPALRSPFTGIEQNLQSLKQEASNGSSHIAGELDKQFDALKSPLDSLINLSSRILSHDQFTFAETRLDEVAGQAIRGLRTMAEARKVRVELESSSALPAVFGDASKLEEAVFHLLHNAIKFNKIGGTVQVECGVLGAYVYLRVIDTGVGIPEDRLKTVWTGLTELNADGSRRVPGLGVVLVRFITAAHGGYVEARSKYGSGSVFAMYLPLVFSEVEMV